MKFSKHKAKQALRWCKYFPRRQRLRLKLKLKPVEEHVPWNPPGDPQVWIVGSACRFPGPFLINGKLVPEMVIASSRHWDALAHTGFDAFKGAFESGRIQTLNPLYDRGIKSFHADQGFFDQFQRYWSREDAMRLVKEGPQKNLLKGKQPLYDHADLLFSEMLH